MKKLILLLIVLACGVGEIKATDYIPVYIKMGSIWKADSPRIAIYMWKSSNENENKWWSCTELSDGYWRGMFDTAYDKMIIARMNPNNATNNFTTGEGQPLWNKSADMSAPVLGSSYYTIGESIWDGENPTGKTIENSDASTIHSIYVKNTEDGTPKLYTWFEWDKQNFNFNGGWSGTNMSSTTIHGQTWYVYKTIETNFKAIVNTNGDDDKTGDTEIDISSNDVYFYYTPSTKSLTNTVAKTISSEIGYATFGSASHVKLSDLPENVTAYTLKVVDGELTSNSTTDDLLNTEGVLLKNERGENVTLHLPIVSASPSANSNNQLVAVHTETDLTQSTTGYTNYILTNKLANGTTGRLAFYKVNSSGSYVNAGTAYLKVPDDSSLAPEYFLLDNESTGINQTLRVTNDEMVGKTTYYNVSGQQVSKPTKGIYIVNGRKMIVK